MRQQPSFTIKEEGKEKQQNQPLICTNRKKFCCGIKVNDKIMKASIWEFMTAVASAKGWDIFPRSGGWCQNWRLTFDQGYIVSFSFWHHWFKYRNRAMQE